MVNKQEVEEAIKDKDDFIKINYLNRFLKKVDNLDMKKFLLLSLASVNESRNMIHEAVKNVSNAGDIAITYREKRELYIKEADLWIKIGNFNLAEKALHRAFSFGNTQEREEMESQYLESFRARGKNLENTRNTRKAIEVYERLLQVTKSIPKKYEVKEKLLKLYNKTGKLREHERLKGREF